MEIGCIGTPFEFKFLDNNGAPAGSFEGYGAVFGNVDSHGDVIEAGAFGASLTQRKAGGRGMPPMYKQHGMASDAFDPVGVWDAMSEDASGLHVKGRIVGLDTERGRYTYAQAKEGALTGLSIGYRVMPNGSRKGSGRVGEPALFLDALHLSEVSLVDDPSNALARVGMIKSAMADDRRAAEGIKTIREFEEALRDVLGYSRAAAKAIAIRGFKVAEEDALDIASSLAPLDRLANLIKGYADK